MATIFKTGDPHGLLKAFDQRIEQSEPKGKITTWERHAQNGITYYTHRAQEWRRKAFFRPAFGNGTLEFNIVKPKEVDISVTVYGYYHGHLSETFLNHFDDLFSEAVCTAAPVSGDIIATA